MKPADAIAGSAPRFLNAGDGGLVVELGQEIRESINAQVLALDRALTERALPGIRETVPTYRSLLIQFDPLLISRAALRQEVLRLWPPIESGGGNQPCWLVPVVYGGQWGVDLDAVAEAPGI